MGVEKHVRIVALKKLALIVKALADALDNHQAKTETMALLKVLLETITDMELDLREAHND